MENLSMCRICLAEDIRLLPIVGTHLQEMYEDLVLMPLETKDGRPLLICFICYTRLKNCYELKKSCLQSEELLTQMLSSNESKQVKLQGLNNKKRLTMHNVVHLSMGHEQEMNADNVGVEAPTSDVKDEPINRGVTITSRPSYSQLEGLVEFLEQNSSIAKGLLRTFQAKIETKAKWGSLATRLNALGGAVKDGQGWAKYWAEKKFALKKHCAKASASIKSSGGGAADYLPTLSVLDRRLLAVMGGPDFAGGDQSLRVKPFPELVSEAQDTGSFTPVKSSVKEPPASEASDVQHSSMQSTTEDPGPSRLPRTTATMPASPTPLPRNIARPRRRVERSVDSDMRRFARIEARRVEAEMTAAQALTKIAEALMSVSEALREIAKKMPEP